MYIHVCLVDKIISQLNVPTFTDQAIKVAKQNPGPGAYKIDKKSFMSLSFGTKNRRNSSFV